MISELKGTTDHNHWALQTPPSSPSSLGSRKSSMCSLGSIHSSSSGSVASHSQVRKWNIFKSFFLFSTFIFSFIYFSRTNWWIRLVMQCSNSSNISGIDRYLKWPESTPEWDCLAFLHKIPVSRLRTRSFFTDPTHHRPLISCWPRR